MSSARRMAGLAPAEAACVLGLCGILAGVAVFALAGARVTRQRESAAAATARLDGALRCFVAERGVLPFDLDGDGKLTCQETVGQLKSSGFLDLEFSPLDPWGRPYVIALSNERLGPRDDSPRPGPGGASQDGLDIRADSAQLHLTERGLH